MKEKSIKIKICKIYNGLTTNDCYDYIWKLNAVNGHFICSSPIYSNQRSCIKSAIRMSKKLLSSNLVVTGSEYPKETIIYERD